jgi:D-alanyl-D-alanine carboxypeptidase
MRTTVGASEQFGSGAGYGLGLLRCSSAVTARSGHGGEIPGHATVAFSSRDAARQLILVRNLVSTPDRAVQTAVKHALNQGLSCQGLSC